ncbi:MAG: shikimate dehydrogenase [Bacteroidetes bacterium]|nr:shikimate dehydrogenase [Bacteroidota bacterium]
MRIFGLIGNTLTHSWSKKYFDEKFSNENITDASYELFPIPRINEVFKLIFQNKDIVGLNVTIPYKEQIMPYLNEISEEAKKIGAVNTLKIKHLEDEISIKAYNTDIYGFEESIRPYLSPSIKKALILGTGGSSKAVAYVFEKHKIDYTMVSRLKKSDKIILWHEIKTEEFKAYDIIVNATPIGMYPNSGEKPLLPYHLLNSKQILFDLIYNPEKTCFLKEGKKKGCTIINGLEMLKKQAEKSWEIWNE